MKNILDTKHFFLLVVTAEWRPGMKNFFVRGFKMQWLHSGKGHGVMMNKSDYKVLTWKKLLFHQDPMTLFHLVPPLFESPSHTLFRTGLLMWLSKTFLFLFCFCLISHQCFDVGFACSVPAECLHRAQGVFGSIISSVGHIKSIKKHFWWEKVKV